MKSRVINTKHLIKVPEGYIGYTSKLKPSLFYGNPEMEGVVWLQSIETNKMACFKLTNESVEGKIKIWTYTPTQKFIDKFPHLEGKTFVVKFDLWQDTKLARKKRTMDRFGKVKKQKGESNGK